MIGFCRGILLAGAVVAAFGAGTAPAQENLDAGKTPAQLYAADCAICHKTPQGMTKSGGMFGLADFLREHYTASREAAAAIAAYVQAVDKGPAPPAKKPAGKRTAKGDEKGKLGEPKAKPGEKAGEIKSDGPKGDTKSGETKPGESKPAEAKATDSKAAEPKPTESKSTEPKSTESKSTEPKSADSKPAAPKVGAAKPAAKDENKDEKKSD
jgi:hypothetical protein